MRRRLALPKHFVRNSSKTLFRFREALGVRTRPRVALALQSCYTPVARDVVALHTGLLT